MEFKNLILTKQYRYKNKHIDKQKTIIGFDTETYDGKAFLLCDSENSYTMDSDNMIEWLMQRKYRDSINFFYNIDYDVMAILKNIMDFPAFKKLYYSNEYIYDDITIKYIPRKFFNLKKDSNSVSYYDLFQFYNMSLDNASKTYLNEEKIKIETKDFPPEYVKLNRDKIIEYCNKDASLTKRLGDNMQKCFSAVGGMYKPISQAYISQHYFLTNCNIPNILKLPIPIIESAFNSYHGGRFEVIKKGCMDKMNLYDIHSAYPSAMRELLDYTIGKWTKTTLPSVHGFYKVKIIFNDNFIYPQPIKSHEGIIKYPKNFMGWITGHELTYYIENNLCQSLSIIEGFSWQGKEVFPLKETMEYLYDERQKSAEKKYAIKILSNSIYGKFIQKNYFLEKCGYEESDYFNPDEMQHYKRVWKTGCLFNPLWASEITALTRIKLFDNAIKYDAVSMATDSILTEKFMPESDALGGWGLEKDKNGKLLKQIPTIILGSGIYQLGEENTDNFLVKLRGIHKKISLKKMLNDNTENDFIKLEIVNVQKLGKTIVSENTDENDFKDLNNFKTETKQININFDIKRVWESKWKNCDDVFNKLIESKPPISII